jgi:hypothetical protein
LNGILEAEGNNDLGVFRKTCQALLVEVIIMVVGNDDLQVRCDFLEIFRADSRRGLSLGQEGSFREDGIDEPVLPVQADQKSAVTRPEDKIIPRYGEDSTLRVFDHAGQIGSLLLGVFLWPREFPTEQREKAFLLLRHPGVEKSARPVMRAIEKLRVCGFYGGVPCFFVKRRGLQGARPGKGEQSKQRKKQNEWFFQNHSILRGSPRPKEIIDSFEKVKAFQQVKFRFPVPG